MSKTTLSESTQKRLLQLAHLSHYQDEVISEMKKNSSKIIREGKKAGDEHEEAETAEEEKEEHEGGRGEKDEKHKGKKVKVDHVLADKKKKDQYASKHAPSGTKKITDAYHTAPMVGEQEDDMEGADVDEAPVGDEVTIDLADLAEQFGELLSNATGVEFTVTVGGAGKGPAVEDEYEMEDELGLEGEGDLEEEGEEEGEEDELEGDFGAEDEGDLGPEDEELPPVPAMESKKVSKMIFDAVMEKLAKKAGIDLKEAKRKGSVQVELKKKSLNEVFGFGKGKPTSPDKTKKLGASAALPPAERGGTRADLGTRLDVSAALPPKSQKIDQKQQDRLKTLGRMRGEEVDTYLDVVDQLKNNKYQKFYTEAVNDIKQFDGDYKTVTVAAKQFQDYLSGLKDLNVKNVQTAMKHVLDKIGLEPKTKQIAAMLMRKIGSDMVNSRRFK